MSLLDPLLAKAVLVRGRLQYASLMRAVSRAARVQERALSEKLARTADSAFGQEHHFERIHSYRDYVSRVPVQTYEEVRPYIQRVMAGEITALFGRRQPVLMFATTSGTVDQPKYVPVTAECLTECRRGWSILGAKALLDHPAAFRRGILQVASPLDETRTELGVPCGSISGLLAATQKRVVQRYYVTPRAVAAIADPDARYYCIMRLALPRDVAWMVTASPATQLRLARTGADQAEALIRDIHDGALRPPGDLPHDVQQALAAPLSPDRQTALRLRELWDRHGELLPKHYWQLSFLANWTGGTMGLHLRDFPRYFGETPVRDIGLVATEGRVSIPMADGTPAGVLDISSSFFEFVEAGADASNPSAVHRCHELSPGCEYRLLMTTSGGLFRYDLGDYVRVHEYLGQAPMIEFLHRGAFVSSMTGEKLTEWQVTKAFEQASRALGVRVAAFVLAPCWGNPPFYRLHTDAPVSDPTRLTADLDAELSRMNIEYRSKRTTRRLGPIDFNLLPTGALGRLEADRLRRQGASSEQYKHQYLYSRPGEDGWLPQAGVSPEIQVTAAQVSFGFDSRRALRSTCDAPDER